MPFCIEVPFVCVCVCFFFLERGGEGEGGGGGRWVTQTLQLQRKPVGRTSYIDTKMKEITLVIIQASTAVVYKLGTLVVHSML